jgi:phi13 family phage major tail protein
LNEQKGIVIGIKNVYIADVTADTSGAYTTGTPEFLANVGQVTITPAFTRIPLDYDNRVISEIIKEGLTTLSFVFRGMPPAKEADLLGKYYDAASGRLMDSGKTSAAPYKAIGFTIECEDGDIYVWYNKGKFTKGALAAQSSGQAIVPGTISYDYNAMQTIHEFTVNSESVPQKVQMGTTADANFLAYDPATNWFTQVQTPDTTSAPGALSLSASTPTGGASGISKTADFALTFSNEINPNLATFILVRNDTGAKVTITGTSWNAAAKIATLTHGSLTGSTLHSIIYSVTDVYGQELEGVVAFTTAA